MLCMRQAGKSTSEDNLRVASLMHAGPYISGLHSSQRRAPELCRQGMLQVRSSRAYLSGLHSDRNERADPYRRRCRSSAASAHHSRCLSTNDERPTIKSPFCIMILRSFTSPCELFFYLYSHIMLTNLQKARFHSTVFCIPAYLKT